MILESVENDPLIWPTVKENGVTRTKKYADLSAAKKIQANCDMKATNIILHGLLADIYSHERECRLYDAFDKFTHIKEESLHKYYLRFTQLINDINIYNMKIEQFRVNTKFLNNLLPKWRDDPIACLNKAMAFLTAVASSRGNNASRQAMVVIYYNCQGEGHMARQCIQPKQPKNAASYKDKAMLAEAQEDGQILDEEQLVFLADRGVPDGQAIQTIIPHNVAFQTEDLDTYDSDCDDVLNAKSVLMDNISIYGFDVLLEVPHSETYLIDMENQRKANKEQNNESVTAELKRYNERVKTFEQRLNIDLSSREKMIDSQMDDMIKEKLALKEQVDLLEQNLSKRINEKECLLQTFTVFKSKSKENEAKYMENESDLEKNIKELDNIIFKVGQSTQQKLSRLNQLYKDFRKRFVLQQELSADEAFWYRMLNPSTKSSGALPIKIEAPKKISKVSLVNESLKKLKLYLANFDKVVKIRTIPNARIEGEWGFKHTKAVFNNEIIPFLKSLKDIFNVFDKDLLNEIIEVQTVFDQMNAAIQQSSVDKQCLEIARKELLLENDQLLQQIMSQDVLLTLMNSMSLKGESVNMKRKRNKSCDKCFNLDAEQGKEIVNIAAQKPSTNTIVPGMFKLDLDPLAPKLLQNKEAHTDYLKYTQEQADILWGMVEQAKAKKPLDNALNFACKHAQRIQELLVYVQDTCPNANNLSAKKVPVTPKNNVKKVRIEVFY
nr:hypothetical protein [Tanacetum cinerariifolium]